MARKSKKDYNAYMKEYTLKRYHRRMQEAIAHLGGKCIRCGSTEDLHLHHIDPKTKSFTIGSVGSSKKRFWEEVNKCALLCRKCHEDEYKSKFPCGTAQRYWRGCRCEPCTKANSQHSREYKLKRQAAVSPGASNASKE